MLSPVLSALQHQDLDSVGLRAGAYIDLANSSTLTAGRTWIYAWVRSASSKMLYMDHRFRRFLAFCLIVRCAFRTITLPSARWRTMNYLPTGRHAIIIAP